MGDIAQHLRTLGLDAAASPEEVRQAWLDLVQVWHPDRFAGNVRLQQKAEEQLKHINDAYEKLRGLDFDELRAPRNSSAAPPPKAPFIREEKDAGQRHPLDVLNEGVVVWNLWRKKFADIAPNLERAHLGRRDLSGIDFREVNLSGANLQDADLYKANLSGARLLRARLVNADLNRAIAAGASFQGADLSGVNLSGADLRQCDLSKARLDAVNLVAADLSGANLEGATGLLRRNLLHVTVDPATRLPRLADDYPGAPAR